MQRYGVVHHQPQVFQVLIPRHHRSIKVRRVTIIYQVESEELPSTSLRLKIEINTREHFTVLGIIKRKFKVCSSWFEGDANVSTYHLEELLGTKLRALF